jgi:sec-independent protein translocase protein TatA
MPFGLQPLHLVVIAIVALLVFGPQKLPEIGRGLGKAMTEFRRGLKDMSVGFQEEIEQPVKPAAAAQQPVVYQPLVVQAPTPIPVQTAPQTGTVFCSICGSPNLAGAHFCNACGSPLANVVDVKPQLVESQPVALTVTSAESVETAQASAGESAITNS